MNENKAIEWLEEDFNRKWRRFGAKETMVWDGQEITYFSCWHYEMGNLRYRNPGTMMKIKDDYEQDDYELENEGWT